MEYEERDSEVVSLLSKLKATGSSYPVDLLAARRQRFVKQIAALGFGTVAALALKESAKAAGGASFPAITGTILETALILAIVAEAGYVAIVHREKILDWFRQTAAGPTIGVISTSPDADLPPIEMPVTGPTLPTPAIETVQPTIASTVTPTVAVTPLPTLLPVTATEEPGNPGDEVEVEATAQPGDDQRDVFAPTAITERTRESGGDGGDSKPVKDDPKSDDHENNNPDEVKTKDPKK
jgi:hypothetical protein